MKLAAVLLLAAPARVAAFASMPSKSVYASTEDSVTCASYAYTVMADTKADTASSTAIEVGSSFRYYYNTLAECESMCTLWSGWSGGDECVGFVDYRDKEPPYCVLVSSYTTVADSDKDLWVKSCVTEAELAAAATAESNVSVNQYKLNPGATVCADTGSATGAVRCCDGEAGGEDVSCQSPDCSLAAVSHAAASAKCDALSLRLCTEAEQLAKCAGTGCQFDHEYAWTSDECTPWTSDCPRACGDTGETACTQDCAGEWGGSAYEDNCGACVGGTTGNVACTPDCASESDWPDYVPFWPHVVWTSTSMCDTGRMFSSCDPGEDLSTASVDGYCGRRLLNEEEEEEEEEASAAEDDSDYEGGSQAMAEDDE
jgi:hypothetical protein